MNRQTCSRIVVLLTLINFASAQESPRLADQPVFIARFHGLSRGKAKEYLQRLNQDLQVGTNILAAIERPETIESVSSLDAPASGLLVYMAQGLIPSAEQIGYSEVTDEKEFAKLIQAQKRPHKDSAVLEGSNDKYKLAVSRVSRVDVTGQSAGDDANSEDTDAAGQILQAAASNEDGLSTRNAEPGQVTVRVGIDARGVVATSTETQGNVVEEGDRRYLEQTTHDTTWFRYHDGFMFTSQSSSLWDMSLPTGESLRKENNSDLSGEIVFFPDRIPMGFRHLAWNAINTVSGTELQQQDDEPDAEYAMRRTSGDAGLALLQASIFDTQEISGWMRLATDDELIRGELKIEARRNSNLGKSLRDLASARSRFAPVLHDDAAATLHFAANLADDWQKAAQAFRAAYTDLSADTNDDASASLQEVYRSLLSSADHGTLEALLKVGWTEESGAVLYGGLHVDENPNLLQSILTVMASGATTDESYQLIQKGDLQLLQVLVPPEANPDSLHLSHFYLAHSNSCLWFALGGENAHDILRQSLTRIGESSGRQLTPLFTATVDLQQWMAFPQEDPTGLALLPQVCCQMLEALVSEIQGEALDESPENVGLAMRALQLEGSKDLSLVIDADQSGLVMRGTLGSALARSWLAIVLSVVDKSQELEEQQ